MNNDKEYTGSVYIGVVGQSHILVDANASINQIHRWHGDIGPIYISATKGFEARQQHLNSFMESRCDFLLLLDHDQIFQPDTLDRLRHHRLPYVTGYYMFRSAIPRPVWFSWQKENRFPMTPYYEVPERGKLVKLGASGWGCMLVHREVVEGVRGLLKGEKEILEDDMDIWPYDLKRILAALQALETHGDKRNVREVAVSTLREEIRPLRYVKDNIGSDLRFPFFAREAGYTLWGDPDVRCGHFINYPVSPDDYEQMNQDAFDRNRQDFSVNMVKGERKRLAEAAKEYADMNAMEVLGV